MAALALGTTAGAPAGGGSGVRWPSSADRIVVFEDQLASNLPPGLLRFAATHYAGSQKLPASQVDALRSLNPGFVVLQYRLGLGLGYRSTAGGCTPDGDWIRILDGDRWIREWPAREQERWFTHRAGRRVLQCRWGWYLTNPDDPSWRRAFTAALSRQIRDTHADAAFLDSVSVPNALGPDSFSPPLPPLDLAWERAWSARIERWLAYVRRRIGRPVLVNAGSWVTTRDRTDYSGADGIMLEGFATDLAPADWALELDRALGLVRRGKVVIAQSYPGPGDVDARVFDLASYLLIKGEHTYVNLETASSPEWFPEYDVDLGTPQAPPPQRVEELQEQGVYVRRYAHGLVVVNPGDTPARYRAGRTTLVAAPVGGGVVPASGTVPSSWRLLERPAGSVVALAPRRAAILLYA